ncbi:hypothetical protein [Prosthecomicrobium sp. N25]|uniref:hypothetical protein n=1 Tax=Prosthecomicrobium sp. N25 TaxID=3129254 RepID=UPI003077BC9E
MRLLGYALAVAVAVAVAAGAAAPAAAAPTVPLTGPARIAAGDEALVTPVHGSHCSRQWSNRLGWHSHCARPRAYYYGPRYGVRPYYRHHHYYRHHWHHPHVRVKVR